MKTLFQTFSFDSHSKKIFCLLNFFFIFIIYFIHFCCDVNLDSSFNFKCFQNVIWYLIEYKRDEFDNKNNNNNKNNRNNIKNFIKIAENGIFEGFVVFIKLIFNSAASRHSFVSFLPFGSALQLGRGEIAKKNSSS